MPAFIFDITDKKLRTGTPEILLPGKFSDPRSTDPTAEDSAESVVAYCDRADAYASVYRLPLSVPRLSMLLMLEEYEERVLATLCTRERRIANVALKGSEEVDISPGGNRSPLLLVTHPFAFSHDVAMPFSMSRLN